MLRFYEGRALFASTGLPVDRGALRGLGSGVGVAVVFVAAWVSIGLASGTVHFAGFHPGGPVEVAFVILFGVLSPLRRIVMIGVEEQLYRGWMLQAVGHRWGKRSVLVGHGERLPRTKAINRL
ncbi:hypothetical protein Nans01_24130 [Nocardiopsis ansamitocini]|uniref:Uncharacterized protein n=1 Tax=Nocardiopsis ansamitocini TaxID=1670832 RepID=A0A9W6UIU5_9ACTN|nr:hypothetical protein Nans01_24130 [Nocardiopsis ansamitocini]